MTSRRIIVLEGDQTGQELLEESWRVLSPEVMRVPVEFARYGLSEVKMTCRKLLPALMLFLAALACTRSGPPAIPTVNPANAEATTVGIGVPTQPAATAGAPTPMPPTEAPTATATMPEATPAPSATLSPETKGQEAVLVLEPGEGSAVASPAHIAGEADPTFEQSLVAQISSADGTILATANAQISAEVGQRGPFSVDLAFSVDSHQPGRMAVYAVSPRDGGLIHLASVDVTLLAAGGAAALNPTRPHTETIALFAPALLANLSGGAAHITGFSEYVFENQLSVAICGQGGVGAPDPICGTADNRVGAGTATVQSPDIGQPGPLETDVTYTVPAAMRGRIVVYSVSPRDGGVTHLSSQEVVLAP